MTLRFLARPCVRRPMAALLLGVLASPHLARAQARPGRRLLGTTTVGSPTPVYVEAASVRRHGDTVTAVIRVALVPPLRHPAGELRSSRTMAMYDCARHTVATKESWYFFDEGGKREAMHRQVKLPGFGPTGTGNVADVAWRALCAAR